MSGLSARPYPIATFLLVLAVIVVLLAVVNLLTNEWAPGASLLVSLAAAVLLLGIGRAAGLTWTEMGLGRVSWVRGTQWGGWGVLVIAAAYAAALALPAARAAAESSPGARVALHKALVEVPLGTVLLEEVAFRGVLWGLVDETLGPAAATVISSALFGVWHVLPALGSSSGVRTPAVLGTGAGGRATWALITVLATGAAGVVFCGLRIRSGSLLAPVLVHWGLNGLGFAFRAAVGNAP